MFTKEELEAIANALDAASTWTPGINYDKREALSALIYKAIQPAAEFTKEELEAIANALDAASTWTPGISYDERLALSALIHKATQLAGDIAPSHLVRVYVGNDHACVNTFQGSDLEELRIEANAWASRRGYTLESWRETAENTAYAQKHIDPTATTSDIYVTRYGGRQHSQFRSLEG